MQYNYGSLLNMGFRFFDAERVGALPPNFPISWRGPALLQVRPLPYLICPDIGELEA